MIVFQLTMPHRGSWNNAWSGDKRLFVRTRRECMVPKELWGRDFYYRWPDGWEACVSVTKVSAYAARKLEKKSDGFSGYDWMITSLLGKGYISPSET